MKFFDRSAGVALLLLVFAACPASAQDAEALEEQRALGFVKLVQAGDSEALLQYMHDNWTPPEEGDDREARWQRITGMLVKRHAGLEIVGVLADAPHEITIVTEEQEGPPLSFVFEFESEPPHRIISMGVEAGERDRGPKLPPLEVSDGADTEAVSQELGRWFDQLAEDGLFSGTALVAWQGKTLFKGAWGLANVEWNVPNAIDTRFDLGSINKSFTKIAVGQLVHQGKLSFDDKIADHLPDYPNSDVAQKVTIRHLLDHTSGLGDIFTDEFFRSSKALYRTPHDFFPLFADKPLRFEPGEGREYSNAGFMVLGAIVEAASGEPYDKYVAKHIFEPSGMANSGFFAKDEPVPNVAVGYTRIGFQGETTELRNNLYVLPIKGNSAGSAQSTVEDLLRFDTALREHQLLPPAYTHWYFGGEQPSGQEAQSADDDRVTVGIGIAGGAPGVSAVLESDGDLAVIVLSNHDEPGAESVARSLFRPLRRVLQ